MKSERIEWIDVAKGIGALLVIIGHMVRNEMVNIVIYAFHMPLFFFLSGVTFYGKKGFKNFISKKFKAIIIPYLIFSIPVFAYYCAWIIKDNTDVLTSIFERFVGIFICWKQSPFYNGIWFLPCIFGTYIIAYFVFNYIKDKKLIFVIAVIAFALGQLLNHFEITLPLGFDTSLISFLFMAVGYLCKDLVRMINKYWCLLFIPMIGIAIYNKMLTGQIVEMFANEYGNIFLFVITGFMGIFATISLSKFPFLEKTKRVQQIGKDSTYYYAAQVLPRNIYLAIVAKIAMDSWNDPVKIVVGLVVSVALLIFMWMIKPIYKKIENIFLSH